MKKVNGDHKDKHLDDELMIKEKHIFIDRILKLAIEEQKLTLEEVLDETNTVLNAVRDFKYTKHICRNIL